MNTPQCLLSCGCWVSLPLNYAVLYSANECSSHGTVSVMRVNLYEWRIRCRGCRYGRWCGQDQEGARHRAAMHRAAHPDHHVAVAYDRVTWDGKGTVLRFDGTRPRRNPPPDVGRPEPSTLDGVIPF